MKPRFEVRAATQDDFDALSRLAQHLNTVNLPNEESALRELLELSAQSFAGTVERARRKFVLLVWDHKAGTAVATSTLITKLGRPDAPYIYLDVLTEEKYSPTLKRHFKHKALRIGFSYDGPTELGGLVAMPEFRGHPEKVGRMASYARFLLIAARRSTFESELLAELLPPLTSDGRSHLWDAFGYRFTHMTYLEADLMSSRDKHFIRDLFPSGTVYASVMTQEAQEVIGKVGRPSQPVQGMLERLGFQYARRVDPFDGGPHYTAETDSVSLVKNARGVPLSGDTVSAATSPHLIGLISDHPPYVRLVQAPVGADAARNAVLSAECREHLQLTAGDSVWCVPLDHKEAPRVGAGGRAEADVRAQSAAQV